MENFKLNDGHSLPKIGFGTYKATEEEGIEVTKFALQNGYRLIDTAAKYNNENAVGKGIKESGIPREEIIITTKVWRENLGYQSTKEALEESVKKLGTKYVDLYLIHWPANARNFENWQQTNAETWRAMEELQQDGKIKSIGVSNFWEKHLDALFQSAKVKPAVNQMEFHPGYWQPEVTAFCKKHDILVEAWSPLARGKVFKNELLKSLAEKYHKSISQVILRWILQMGALPIPKSTTKERILENLELFDFQLSDEEVTQISQLPEMGFSGELPDLWPEVIQK